MFIVKRWRQTNSVSNCFWWDNFVYNLNNMLLLNLSGYIDICGRCSTLNVSRFVVLRLETRNVLTNYRFQNVVWNPVLQAQNGAAAATWLPRFSTWAPRSSWTCAAERTTSAPPRSGRTPPDTISPTHRCTPSERLY